MLRFVACSTALALYCAFSLTADEKTKTDSKDKKQHEATVTKVDANKGTITLKMKDRNGKETERTFTLAEDIRMMDDTGKVVAIDVFRSGNRVLVVEREGKIVEMKKPKSNESVKPNKGDR
jgi:hypothetical protein